MTDFSTDLNQWFYDSTNLMNDFVEKIEACQPEKLKANTGEADKFTALVSNLEDMLFDTQVELKGLDQFRVKHIEPEMLNEMNSALTDMNEVLAEIDLDIEMPMESGMGGDEASTPFLNVIKEVKDLLATIEELKETRGQKVATIEDMDSDGGEIIEFTMRLESRAFKHRHAIPSKYSYAGENISPSLIFKLAPEATESFALLFEDLDAPRSQSMHWLVWNISADCEELPEGFHGYQQGVNSFGEAAYHGPKAIPGKRHRFAFKLYALDKTLELANDVSYHQFKAAIHGHILAKSVLIGTF